VKGISVVVCCYNSAWILPQTTQYLKSQNIQEIDYEIIFVDNNSTDNTQEIIHNSFKETSISYSIVRECEQGLALARSRGIKNAKYDYVIFCDDDNWLESNYVQRAYDLMETNEQIGILGGCAVPEFEGSVNEELNLSGLAINPQSESSGDITSKKGHVYGAGAVFRKEGFYKLDQIGYATLLKDRSGKELSSGNDTELCYAFRLLGYRIYYDDSLKFRHFISESRMTKQYLKRLRAGFKESYVILECYANLLNYRYKNWWKAWLKDILVKSVLAFKRFSFSGIIAWWQTVSSLIYNLPTYKSTYQFLYRTFHDNKQASIRSR